MRREQGLTAPQVADKPAGLKGHGFIRAAKTHKMSAALAAEGCISKLAGLCHQSEGPSGPSISLIQFEPLGPGPIVELASAGSPSDFSFLGSSPPDSTPTWPTCSVSGRESTRAAHTSLSTSGLSREVSIRYSLLNPAL